MSEWNQSRRVRAGIVKRKTLSFLRSQSNYNGSFNESILNRQGKGLPSSKVVSGMKYGVNRSLFCDESERKPKQGFEQYMLFDKTPKFPSDSMNKDYRATNKSRRSILGKRFSSATSLDFSSLSGNTTLLGDTANENDININNCNLGRNVSDKDATTAYGTKPSHTEHKQTITLPNRESRMRFTMSRFKQYQKGVLESPKPPSPSTFCYKGVFLEPVPLSPKMRLAAFKQQSKLSNEENIPSTNLVNQSTINALNQSSNSNDSSLESFVKIEDSILKSENLRDNANSNNIVQINVDDFPPKEINNIVEKEQFESWKLPKGKGQKSCSFKEQQNCIVGIDDTSTVVLSPLKCCYTSNISSELMPMIKSLLTQKDKMDKALKAYLKEKSIFDAELNAFAVSLNHSPMLPNLSEGGPLKMNKCSKMVPGSSTKTPVKVISTKVRSPILLPSGNRSASRRIHRSGRLSSAAKAFNELRANYSFLKTP